jgi:hypothetical protein
VVFDSGLKGWMTSSRIEKSESLIGNLREFLATGQRQ